MMIAVPKITKASVFYGTGSVNFLDLSFNLHLALDAGVLGTS